MSANNVIYIQRRGNNFFVWHTDIDEQEGPDSANVLDPKNWDQAIDEAYNLANEIGIVEYGVQVLPSIP